MITGRDIGTVYCFTSPSGKSYVGQTWCDHVIGGRYRPNGRGARAVFASAIKRYGFGNFVLTLLDEGIHTQRDLDDAEQFWIAYLMTMHPCGYNLTAGGSVGKSSAESKRKNSAAQMGNQHAKGAKRSVETRQKLREAARGNTHRRGTKATAETRAKLSAVARSRGPASDVTRQKLSDAARGRKHTVESKQKMSRNRRGKVCSDEARANMSKSRKGKPSRNKGKPSPLRGRKLSDETKQKMSAAAHRHWQDADIRRARCDGMRDAWTIERRKAHADNQRGELNPMHKSGHASKKEST